MESGGEEGSDRLSRRLPDLLPLRRGLPERCHRGSAGNHSPSNALLGQAREPSKGFNSAILNPLLPALRVGCVSLSAHFSKACLFSDRKSDLRSVVRTEPHGAMEKISQIKLDKRAYIKQSKYIFLLELFILMLCRVGPFDWGEKWDPLLTLRKLQSMFH